jgi:hypothetical protein
MTHALAPRGGCARLRVALAARRSSAAARQRTVAAASSARERRSSSGKRGAPAPPTTPAPPPPGGGEAAMRVFAQDEILFFTPRRRDHGSDTALRVIYAYPNDYNVGITSLGYQLVWAFLATHAAVDVARLFMDAHEPLPQARPARQATPRLTGIAMLARRAARRAGCAHSAEKHPSSETLTRVRSGAAPAGFQPELGA